MAKSSRRRVPRQPAKPLLSACMIVKDEEAVIERCLAALDPLVDEIVVHDTGSTDRTGEICESMGARVIRGEWRDDFSWARNVSIEAARGEWVLVVDADEVLVPTNFTGLRRLLREGDLDGYRAQVNNAQDVTGRTSVVHTSVRLFRQSMFRYSGRIHEQVVSIASHQVRVDAGEVLELDHWGYLPEVMAAKDKANRNIHLAEVSHQEEGTEKSILETARALSLGNEHERTLERLELIRDAEDEGVRHSALQLGVQIHSRMGHLDEALAWLEDLLSIGRSSALTTYLHGYVLMMDQRWDEAIAVLDTEHDVAASMAHGVSHSTDGARALIARCLVALGREEEGLDAYLDVATEGPLDMWPELLRVLYLRGEMDRAVPAFLGRDMEASGHRLRAALAMLVSCPVEVGDAFAEALYTANPGDRHALAFISMVGHRLPLDRAVTWSARARDVGLDQGCPLLRQADELTIPATQRVSASAAAMQAFGDGQAVDSLGRAARDLSDEEVLEALYTVGEVAPSALETFVLGVVTSQARALVMARALAQLHAEEQAVAVLRMGLEDLDADDSTAELQGMLGELEAAGV